jgi:hypothetical protein
MVDRLKQMPGVQGAAVAATSPIGGDANTSQFQAISGQNDSERAILTFDLVGSGYFHAMQIPMLVGREFEERERNLSVCIVNRSAAKYLFPNTQAIGQLIRSFDTGRFPQEPCRIIGVAEDAKYGNFRQPAPRTVYYPMSSKGEALYGNLTFLVRGARQADVVTAFRKATSEIIPAVPLNRFVRLQQQIDETFGGQRLITVMSDFFGVLALILSAIGLYGLLASSVIQRTAEMGIRMALGARRVDVLGMILKEALLLFAAGIGLGGMILYPATRMIRNMLLHISATDPTTLIGSILVLLAAGFLAAFLPAHRAAAAEPMEALRTE